MTDFVESLRHERVFRDLYVWWVGVVEGGVVGVVSRLLSASLSVQGGVRPIHQSAVGVMM